jgi:DNA-binding CsgD family transcriptional regulator
LIQTAAITPTREGIEAARLAAQAAHVRTAIPSALVGVVVVAIVTVVIAGLFAGIADPRLFAWWLVAMAMPLLLLATTAAVILVRQPGDAEVVRLWLPVGRSLGFMMNLAVIVSPWVLLPGAQPLLRTLMLILYILFMATEVLANAQTHGRTWLTLIGVPASLGAFLVANQSAHAVPLTAFLAVVGASLFVLEGLLVRVKSQAFDADLRLRDARAMPPTSMLPAMPPASMLSAMSPPVPQTINASDAGLTRRQIEVLGLLARGMTNKQIAGVLAISPATVKTHVADIIAITGAANRTGATMQAQALGLL